MGVCIIFICTSGFGLVEYSAMRPQTYWVGTDSTRQAKQALLVNEKKDLAKIAAREQEQNSQDANTQEEGTHWSKYVLLVVKYTFTTLMNLINFLLK